jgi:hypothetical protein
MKPINSIAATLLAVFMAASLSACGPKNNGSTNNAAAATSCTLSYDGTYRDQLGRICNNPTATTAVCPATGLYTYPGTAQQVQCIPGQQISTLNGLNNPYYTSNPLTTASGCDQWTQMYGIPYIPVILGNQYQCLRYDLVQGYTAGTPYANYSYSDYYANPVMAGPSCGTNIGFGTSGFGISLCF